MPALVPKNSLAYFEIKELSETIRALTENETFQNYSSQKPDISALKNVQIAVSIIGFETSASDLSDENSELNFKPKFVVIVETHQWNRTALSIAEQKIGAFAKNLYGKNVKFETKKKENAKFFIWESAKGEKILSAVTESLIYVSNDEGVLNESLKVKRGESENLLKNADFVNNQKDETDKTILAFGTIFPEGIKQLSDLASVWLAVKSGDSEELQSFIAQVAPQILRNSVEQINWRATTENNKITDRFFVSLKNETASIFNKTLAPSDSFGKQEQTFPAEATSVTRYNLQNPLVAWRSVVLVTANNADSLSGKFIVRFADSFLAAYGVIEPENFLDAVDSEISTVKFGKDEEKSAIIATIKIVEKVKKSLSQNINFNNKSENIFGVQVWKNNEEKITAAFIENKLIYGDDECVLKILEAKQSEHSFAENKLLQKLPVSDSTAATIATEFESGKKIISVLGELKQKDQEVVFKYFTQTRFTAGGIERKTVSDFGFLGAILENFSVEE